MASSNSPNKWIFDIQTTIYSRIKSVLKARLGSTYSDLNVTENSHVTTTPKYPSVYVHFLQPAEVGKDLDGSTVNAIYLTVEINVTVTQAQGMTVANKVNAEILDIMKEMRFNATMPEFNDTNSEYRTVSRYTRTIGNADVLFTNPTT